MKHLLFLAFAFSAPLLACDVTVSDPSEDACSNYDTQCKGAKTLDDNGELTPVAACNKDQFGKYKNSIGVQSCVRDAESCSSAQACIDGAERK